LEAATNPRRKKLSFNSLLLYFFPSQQPYFNLRTLVHSYNFIAMPPHAPRIPHAIWERHREEIIATYTSGDLPQTMAYMSEKYGFQATYSQPSLRLLALYRSLTLTCDAV
jgi:hypothetical protein